MNIARLFACLFVVCIVCQQSASAQSSVTLTPISDNTLYESGGDLSNALGPFLFTGSTLNAGVRRALMRFDLSGIPPGSTVEQVDLTVNVSRSQGGDRAVTLHRLASDWGEGTSNAGNPGGQGAQQTINDPTWTYAFFNTVLWSTPGGDFVTSPSATVTIGDPGDATWSSTADLVSDVQSWVDNPAENFGWIAIGDESTTQTAKRFGSRDTTDQNVMPRLTVRYVAVATANESLDVSPPALRLLSSYPNPFSSKTTLSFDVGQAVVITLTVYDVLGREVMLITGASAGRGTHTLDVDGSTLPPGLYLYRLENGVHVATGTLVRTQ